MNKEYFVLGVLLLKYMAYELSIKH